MDAVGAPAPSIQPRVFVVMPFRMSHASRLRRMIQATCQANQIEALLADEPIDPVAPLRSDITEQLQQAEAVIVDLTGLNANVTYELGVARALCKDILLLRGPGAARVPEGLAGGLPCVQFGDLRERSAQEALSEELNSYFRELRDRLQPEVLDLVRTRTTRIIDDLRELASRPPQLVRRQTVWCAGFLSSFALGRREALEASEVKAADQLREERDCLLELARKGCRVVCMISPPDLSGLSSKRSHIVLPRILTLLEFLASGDPALDHIDWIVSPFWQKNFLIIGNISCYERFQKGTDRGDAVTLRQAAMAAIRSSTAMYERLFDHLTGLMLSAPPPSDPRERREILRQATTERLEEVRTWLE